ncbi:uncharacterized protein N7518_008747 [Penicillium psychrosexuale]|uniref:uncharacterized protein n=1 Tax=Penicillium psychrosexuale TaxID=1002107 RepID=UPI0025457A19|nr:uncharacterized protein N7518_008747 [Penicillium psychrosexuale]KAJ5791736.1 hypothetical protein N7518_008747 [Penicillium psychrosexuale]
MGNKVSAVHGVKSDHFYDQGNAVNEIWVGDVEVISRLPFGDSDLEQAGWPPGDFPKIPWHHFIIPMHKRDEASNMTTEIPLWARNEACCQVWNPKNGYLGMYMSISPCAAYFIGVAFLLLAFGTYFHFLTCVSAAIFDWRDLREASRLCADPPAIRRMANHKLLSSLAKAFIVAALSILCLVLGLPAAAAGMRTMDAATFILINGLGVGIVATIGVVGIPLSFLWLTRKPRRVETFS